MSDIDVEIDDGVTLVIGNDNNGSKAKSVIVPGPGSRSYRVPTLPDPTGYYYCTL